jgi:hypothetical protein
MTDHRDRWPAFDALPRACRFFSFLLTAGLGAVCLDNAQASDRPRVIIETDAGGDPDDEQSLVRFLVYANEFDVEGVIANRAVARPGENKNRERTGLGIVRALVDAYGECWTNLVQHDRRYPTKDFLWNRTVTGYGDLEDGVSLIVQAVDAPDQRPVWFMNWGTDNGSAESCLKRALDRILTERGPDRYARFKQRIRLASADKFAEHTTTRQPAFPLWIDTFRPEIERRRWYHRFSALTSTAGGFDVLRDVLQNHGPLGALYPTNTTHWCKEGDTMTFLYLVPVGMNDPNEPTWGSWAGRHGLNENFPGKPYYWANQLDSWNGSTNRDNILARWGVDLQNDFRARMDWCVRAYGEANHPPEVRLRGETRRAVRSGENVTLDASGSRDPDSGQQLEFEWWIYREPGTFRGDFAFKNPRTSSISFQAPRVETPVTMHCLLTVRDNGTPSLTRYSRVVLAIEP